MRTVIFDLDGTLADTSGDLIAAANGCFEALGHGPQLDPRADAATAFRGGRAMLRLGFERLGADDLEVRVDAQYQPFLERYGAQIDTHTRLYPGAMAAVETLRQAGFAIGMCTNKPEGLAEVLLQRLGVRSAFASLVGADTLPVRKPDPAPYRAAVDRAGGQVARSLLVGDTVTDRDTARACGVPCVMVTFGPDGRKVAALEPDALLEHFDALPSVVDRLIQ
ncbi:HAD-IA family hydrolase [Tropicimonas marinistellae]|uniref:HAD-IA family hydrolase n=1 Tax=Tropicimonas marinistellae TaxID=1739787 RepID=UPI000836AEEA|nr:HAD-IA family hydrolase [Tropicimonas marinistellae]